MERKRLKKLIFCFVYIIILAIQQPTTILNEYNQSVLFNSTKTPKSNKRKTIFDISMEIIDQRIKNINRSVRLNRSVSESDISVDDVESSINLTSTKSTPQLDKFVVVPQQQTQITATEEPSLSSSSSSAVVEQPSKPTKRKLFAPPAYFNYPEIDLTPKKTPTKLNKTTAAKMTDSKIKTNKNINVFEAKKRTREDEDDFIEKSQCNSNSVKKIKNNDLIANNSKISRRSSLEFQPEKIKIKQPISVRKSMQHQNNKATITSTVTQNKPKLPFMVYTNMHQQQINVVKEVGNF